MTRQQKTEAPSVAVYCRFSKDEGKAGDSSSIETQKEMLTKYVREQGWRLHDIYVDDGYTGLNMNRPDFQRMMFDVDGGKVNLIVTKDMSRLSRNYLECGMYMEVVFPSKNVRYVALNDGVDTQNQQGMGDCVKTDEIQSIK
ncbi:MAG: recombinase family protein [Defluviitaleaceae bacterium]|nr:recombinase family protein [Defluviitaleaceae bacterium]